nr:hypothetical protein BaRGS_003322 [Batillaria attramentaria]
MLMGGLPVHLVSIVSPFWLQLDVNVQTVKGKVATSYGLWQICIDSQCTGVHSTDTGIVGGWFYSVQLLMVWSFAFHCVAVIVGALQNFLSRRRVVTCTPPFLRKIVHRDSQLAEDIGFAGGFLGQAAHIVFMLCTKEQVSDGAIYSWGFAFGFLSTGAAVLATLALTKSHLHPVPRPAPPPVRPVELQDVNLAVIGDGTAETDFRSRDSSVS